MNTQTKIAALVLLVSLAGCGGGGGGDDPPAPPPNSAPVVAAATLTTTEDLAGTVSVTATDAEGDALTATVSTAPTKGTATVSGTNPFVFTYTPTANQNGADTFQIRVADARGAATTAAVTVTITPVNDAPVLAAQTFTFNEDAPAAGTVVASDVDTDALTFTVTQAPAHGNLQLAANGTFTFGPSANYHGADTFAVQVSDATVTTTTTMNVTVNSVNDDPVVASETLRLSAFTPVLVDVLANDTDVEGDALTVTLPFANAGITSAVVNNQVQITRVAGASGPTRLNYRVSDGNGGIMTGAIQIVLGDVRPLFYTTGAPNSAQRRIRLYDYIESRELLTPIPSGDTFEKFTTSANGEKLVYVTRQSTPLPVRHRLWLVDLLTPNATPAEITTPNGFFANYLELSPDGTLVAFNDRVASTATPASSQVLDNVGIQIDRPLFTADSRQLYYVVTFNGGGRMIKRVDVSAAGVVSNQTSMTASYANPAEGLGMFYRLTPDENSLVSIGLMMPLGGGPGAGIQGNAFVTLADGTQQDLRLHPALTANVDSITSPPAPLVSADSRYAVYRATLNNGVGGIYSTDLQSPGTSTLLAGDLPNAGNHLVMGNTDVFYSQSTAFPSTTTWYRTTVTSNTGGGAFAPVPGAQAPKLVSPAPDASAVVFDAANRVYAEIANGGGVASMLGLQPNETIGSIKYSPDSNAVVIVDSAGTVMVVVNTKAPGPTTQIWPLADFSAGVAGTCFAFAGEGC